MAILNGILSKLNGSAGSLTFKQVNGKTVVSEKATTVRNAKTPQQQRQPQSSRAAPEKFPPQKLRRAPPYRPEPANLLTVRELTPHR